MTRRAPFALATGSALIVLLAACGTSQTGSSPATSAAESSPAVASPTSSPPESSSPAAPSPTSAKPTPTKASPTPQPAKGSYISYSDYQAKKSSYDANGKVVLFFHAPWCPTCRNAEDTIQSQAVPAGLTIVKTDFDSSTDLRSRYGVTVQHTFVQISSDGTQLAKFAGSNSSQEILGKTV